MDDAITAMVVLGVLFIGLPWIILHYITKWKTAATITSDDEELLDELYNLSKRLEDRMETVERLVAHDHAEFTPARLIHDNTEDRAKLEEFEEKIAARKEQQK